MDDSSSDGGHSDWGDAAPLDPHRLYAVLSYRGDVASWNWTFYVPDSAALPIGSVGTLFYVSSSASPEQTAHDLDPNPEDGGINSNSNSNSNNNTGGGGGGGGGGSTGGGGGCGGVVWRFSTSTQDIVTSPLVVAIVRLSDIGFLGGYQDIVAPDGLLNIFRSVAIPAVGSSLHPAEFSSRSWFLDAICTLHDCGVVTCDDVWLLEGELRRFAFTAMDRYLQNKGACLVASSPSDRLTDSFDQQVGPRSHPCTARSVHIHTAPPVHHAFILVRTPPSPYPPPIASLTNPALSVGVPAVISADRRQ
ncbi:hypothetical protein H0H92_008004 [Tricholoma furcatifolium]|nr:hypothetical protein H0H92_008004 [Tricholoma furcatifolium]